MNKFIFQTIILLMFAVSIEAKEPISGSVSHYSKLSEWDKNEHNIQVTALFEGNFQINLIIHADIPEMLDFKINEGSKITVVDERPGALVGRSIYSLSFENDPKVYEAEGSSWRIALEDWGLDNTMYMVTQVNGSKVTLNGQAEVGIIDPSENLLGKIFKIDPKSEKFILDNPGYSYFTYVSLNDGSSFTTTAPSVESHWKPSEEQLQNSVTVTWIGKTTVGMSGHIMGFGLSDGKTLSLGDAAAQVPSWLNTGSRWVKFSTTLIPLGRYTSIERAQYVDLSSGIIIQTEGVSSPSRAIRTIPKKW